MSLTVRCNCVNWYKPLPAFCLLSRHSSLRASLRLSPELCQTSFQGPLPVSIWRCRRVLRQPCEHILANADVELAWRVLET